jgi:tetratricopeptide (TPR) repeat protein
MRGALARQQTAFLAECKWFIQYFPKSRHAAGVLYLAGQSMDARIDLEAFRDRKLLRYYFDFPANTSEAHLTWKKVVHNAEDSTTAAVGRFKLAIHFARRGEFAEAIEKLDEVISRYDPRRPTSQPKEAKGPVKKVLEAAPPEANLPILIDATVFDARRMLSLLLENGNDPLYDKRPFCGSEEEESRQPGLFAFDPRDIHYARNLRRLANAYPDALLRDNLELMLAMLIEDVEERIAALEQCLKRYPRGDAVPENLFRLGTIYLEAGSAQRGRELLERLIQEFPNNQWTPLAIRRLRDLPALDLEAAS